MLFAGSVRHGVAPDHKVCRGWALNDHTGFEADMTSLAVSTTDEPDDWKHAQLAASFLDDRPLSELTGDVLSIAERLVVSPWAGRFTANTQTFSERAVGSYIRAGQLLGQVGGSDILSMFSGQLMGLLARPGERLTVGQPIAWIRT
jgi:[acyl-carrier-protein] S-malonyltransferase